MGSRVSAQGVSLPKSQSQVRGGWEVPILHRAEWLVPVTSPPIPDGAVLLWGRRILAVGSHADIEAVSPPGTERVDHGSAAIMPGLVNAHTHLELSGLAGRIALPQEGFSPWLEQVLALRSFMTPELQREWLRDGQRQLLAGGCCLCGDITNGIGLKADDTGHNPVADATNEHREQTAEVFPQHSAPSTQHSPAPITHHSALSSQHSALSTQHFLLTRQAFLEVLGFDGKSLVESLAPDVEPALRASTTNGLAPSLAAHACYSTSGTIIREAKEWCRTRRLPFSIHVAEHQEEIEFLEGGTGFCRELLENLGRWVPDWTPPGTTPVRYLDRLQVLDAQTLLVHAVHLSDADWEIVAGKQSSVCFCPRSNRNLNVGRPDLAKALRYGVVAALGTDSLASNTDLSLFAEAAYVPDNYADVSPEAIVSMITCGGARALGQERQFGSIEAGKRANLLAVSLPDAVPIDQLFETIIHQGNRGAWRWAHHRAHGCD